MATLAVVIAKLAFAEEQLSGYERTVESHRIHCVHSYTMNPFTFLLNLIYQKKKTITHKKIIII